MEAPQSFAPPPRDGFAFAPGRWQIHHLPFIDRNPDCSILDIEAYSSQ
jgi:hypothetical protein